MLNEVASDGKPERYQPYFAARADLLARLGNLIEAKSCYKTAISLSENNLDKAFLTENSKIF